MWAVYTIGQHNIMMDIRHYGQYITMKLTVENLRDSVEKLSPEESVKGANTVVRGSVRAPKGYSKGKPEAAKSRGAAPGVLQHRICPRKIHREPSHCPAAHCRHPRHSPEGTVIPLFPKDSQQFLRLPIS